MLISLMYTNVQCVYKDTSTINLITDMNSHT